MRKIDEMVLDLLKDIYPLSLDVEEIADLCGYDMVLVKKCTVNLLKEGRITIDEGDKYSYKKD
ncbi:MAG: hypothetical protein ACE5HY_03595 [Candidatus Hydrothermarchaeales archaeon]